MGNVVRLDEYRSQPFEDFQEEINDSMIPVEFAVGAADRDACLAKLQDYGIRRVRKQRVNVEPEATLYMMGVRDAIWLNKKILECEDLDDDEIAQRIDLIQMLENANLALMEGLWKSISRQTQLPH